MTPSRAEVWLAEMDPARGHEQAGTRPCVVMSADIFNRGQAHLAVLVPMTTRERRVRFHVPVNPPEGGLRARSFVMCEALRSMSNERLVERWGTLTEATVARIEQMLRDLMEL